ncbi:MAG: SUMF1/EgtB/PvdO family nonheme iron enzyme [Gammaproteobacteria bacterium]
MRQTLFSFIVILFLGFSAGAHAQRHALVIGNAEYGEAIGSLKNPVNDARDMAALLKKKQFDVTTLLNADKRKMKESIALFTRKLKEKDDVGLFFYAGHGIQVRGRNYLIPIGVNIQSEGDVEFEAVDAGRVMSGMDYAGNNLNLIILDACRNNPFARSFRSSSRGLASMDAPKGSLLLYATSPGDVAADGEGRNGIFTQYLLEAIDTLNEPVERVFKTTAKNVQHATAKKQTPWLVSSMVGEFYFTIDAPNAQTVTITAPAAPGNLAEIAYWNSIKDQSNPAYFTAYLKRYGDDGLYSELAKIKLGELEHAVVDASPASNELETAHLTVRTSPEGAKVRILNIGPKYRDGIELKPGRYHIEVTHPSYKRDLQWLKLHAGDTVHSVVLVEDLKVATAEATPTQMRQGQTAELNSGRRFHEMVAISGGCFQMGSPSDENGRDDDERQHQVCVDTFEIGKTEVTVGEFRHFTEVTGYRTDAEKNKYKQGCWFYSTSDNEGKDRAGYNWQQVGFDQTDRHPVVCVSWNDAVAYIDWLNRETGRDYRLPTEAEWEYAARGGTQSAYFWGNDESSACRHANVHNTGRKVGTRSSFNCDDGYEFTAPVAQFRANNNGLYDMIGNVWEWTCSEYDKAYQGGERRCINQTRVNHGGALLLRGGSFGHGPQGVRSASRLWNDPSTRTAFFGFRLARTR